MVRGRKSADFRVDTSHELLYFSFVVLKIQIKRFGDDCKYTQALDFIARNPYYL